MGGRLGDWWVGKEVEKTDNLGVDTVFFDKAKAFLTLPEVVFENFYHFYFNLNQADWWKGCSSLERNKFWNKLSDLLKTNKVTVDTDYIDYYLYPEDYRFLPQPAPNLTLMLRVTISHLESLNNVAIKFQGDCKKDTAGVYVITDEEFLSSCYLTPWSSYIGDKSGKQWLKEFNAGKNKTT